MKYSKIPPSAARVIALTSVTSFAQDQRDLDEMDATGKKETAHSVSEHVTENPVKVQLESKIGGIYSVEIELGSKTKEVLIDAHNGVILRKRDITRSETS